MPGISVAVTGNGRLLLVKGYGKADVASGATMKRSTRVRIGSVTKATVTGPCGSS